MWGWSRCGEGFMYLTSTEHPIDTGLQLGKACYPCFHFVFFFTLIPIPLSSLSLSFISSTISFLPLFGRQHKMTHKGWRAIKPQHNQATNSTYAFSLTWKGAVVLFYDPIFHGPSLLSCMAYKRQSWHTFPPYLGLEHCGIILWHLYFRAQLFKASLA